MSKKAGNGTSTLNLTWRYDAEENAAAAETDSDGDGLTDVWGQVPGEGRLDIDC